MTKTLAKKFSRSFLSKKDLDDYVKNSPSPHRYTVRAALVYFAKKWGLHEEILND